AVGHRHVARARPLHGGHDGPTVRVGVVAAYLVVHLLDSAPADDIDIIAHSDGGRSDQDHAYSCARAPGSGGDVVDGGRAGRFRTAEDVYLAIVSCHRRSPSRLGQGGTGGPTVGGDVV